MGQVREKSLKHPFENNLSPSPNEGKIMTRKARPASTLFQAVKPFSGVTWGLILIVMASVAVVLTIFDSFHFQRSHFKQRDVVSIIFEVENMFSSIF